MTDPAFPLINGASASWGPEILVNPDFCSGLAGWNAEGDVEWISGHVELWGNGSISQDVELEEGEYYTCTVTFCENSGLVRGYSPGYVSEAYLNDYAEYRDYNRWTVQVNTDVGQIRLISHPGNTQEFPGKIASVSYKKVTDFPAVLTELRGSDGHVLINYHNLPGSDKNFINGRDAGKRLITGSQTVLIGDNAASSALNMKQSVGIGYGTLDGNTKDQHACVGYKAGYGNDAYQLTALGWQALNAEDPGSYCVAIGPGAGMASQRANTSTPNSGGQNIFIGFWSGYQTIGDGNIFLGSFTGMAQDLSDTLVITPGNYQYGPNYIMGVHDVVSTNGYMQIRGSFHPSIDGAFSLGDGLSRWKEASVQALNLGAMPIPENPDTDEAVLYIASDGASPRRTNWLCLQWPNGRQTILDAVQYDVD